jgi:hypothetical protein
MIFLPEVAPGDPRCREVLRGCPRGSLHAVPGAPAGYSSILQGFVALPGISGRVLNTVEIALLRDIAICEFRVSFRGTPAY